MSPMSTIEHLPVADISVLRRLIDDVWHQGRLDIIDELYEAGYVGHDPFRVLPLYGPRELREHIARVRAAFPDIRLEVGDLVVADDRIAFRYVARTTHAGPYGDLVPTGRRVTVAGLAIARFGPGSQIAEEWSCWDALGLERELGMGRRNG